MGGIVSSILSFGDQNRQAQYQQQQTEMQRQILWERQQQQAKQQHGLLERQQAAARAAMSGRGVGIGSGSSAAVLAGMAKQTEQAIADNATLASMQDSMLQANMDNQAGQNASKNITQGLNLAQTGVRVGLGLLR